MVPILARSQLQQNDGLLAVKLSQYVMAKM